MSDFAQARRTMVDCQLRTFDVTDRAVLAAMDEVPRERFVPPGYESLAYADRPIPLPGGLAMLAPMVLARMIQALDIEPGQRVLDVAGSGYSAALLACLGARVTALVAEDGAADDVAGRLREVAATVSVKAGDLTAGLPGAELFDAVLVNGAVEIDPTRLVAQLVDGGRLVCLRHDGRSTRAMLLVRAGDATGIRTLFDAAAPVLPAFRSAPSFTF